MIVSGKSEPCAMDFMIGDIFNKPHEDVPHSRFSAISDN